MLRVTEPAVAGILELRAGEVRAETLGLWIEVSGSKGDTYTYDMYFQEAVDAKGQDWSADVGGLTVVVPTASVERIEGSTLDLAPDGGMVILNPNRPPVRQMASPAMSGAVADLSGDVAQRVIQVLEQQVNPSIASHGGRADLVAVEGDTAYLRLSGGCAGCGMAAVTLSQGIAVALRDAVPEIINIVDVTDHASGTNPYYEQAKK